MNKSQKNSINKGVIYNYSFILLVLFMFCKTTHSQDEKMDTIAFINVQNEIINCSSGMMNYKLNYVTTSFELHWDVELYFTKYDENTTYFYVKQIEDSIISEYVYLNDTLLVFANYENIIYSSKTHTQKPFSGNIRRVFTYLLDEHDLTNFMAYEYVNYYDTIMPSGVQAIVGEAYEVSEANGMDNKYYSKIKINTNNNSLLSCFNAVETYTDSVLFYSGIKEYIINSITLYTEEDLEVGKLINLKYSELDSLIFAKELEKDTTKNNNVIKKDSSIVIPEFAFDWELPLINGDTLSSRSIKSKIIVLDFYYMSCAPCIMAIHDLVKLDSLYNDKEVMFIGVNILDKDLLKLRNFLQEKKIQYPNVINGSELSNKYGFNSFPQTLIIDSETNKLLYHVSGYRSDSYKHYKKLLDQSLSN